MPHVTVCDTNEMPFEEVRRGRVHMIRRKRLPLETGIPGVTMEYSLSVVPDGYFSWKRRCRIMSSSMGGSGPCISVRSTVLRSPDMLDDTFP